MLPSQQPTSLGVCSFPATAAASDFASVLPGVEGFLSHCRPRRRRDLCCPVMRAGAVTWGLPLLELGGLCPALAGHAPLRCGELEGGIATCHQHAGFGVEVSHGLLLAKVCGG